MKLKVMFLMIIAMTTALISSPSSVRFNGMLSGMGQVRNKSDNFDLSFRYLPFIEMKIAQHFDAELSGNIFTYFKSDNPSHIADIVEIKPYRSWIRFTTTRFEARLGLQKINFGTAKILRSLMWFDLLDPKDPLQFTEAVYGLRLKYDFQNNNNVWIWGLYGNDSPKGWEKYATEEKTPEYGARIQIPYRNAELAFSAHHRLIQKYRVPEDRIALDGFWDVGVGVWFESALIHAEYNENEQDYQSFLTLGADYTFPLGNGLNITVENMLFSEGERPYNNQNKNNVFSLSLSYIPGFMDRLSFFSYYNWGKELPFYFLSWQRTYDLWAIHVSGYLTLETDMISTYDEELDVNGSRGIRLMIIFNH